MAYLKFWGAVILIGMALTCAFWVLRMAVVYYFDKRDFDRRLQTRMREIDEDMERQDGLDSN